MSGVDFDGTQLRKGTGDSIAGWIVAEGGHAPPELRVEQLDRIGREGGTPLAVARDERVLGVVYLKDIGQAEGMKARFDRAAGRWASARSWSPATTPSPLRRLPPRRASTTSLAEATPERQARLIRDEQAEGRLVAMTGDGTNDAPALAQADVGRGHEHQARRPRARRATWSTSTRDPTKLIEIVEVGKQLLMTRRRSDRLLDRQRRRQVLRDPARDVRGDLGGVGADRRTSALAEHHGPGQRRARRSSRR